MPLISKGPVLSPLQTYKLLLKRFGLQGWWPVTPRGDSRPRYFPGRYGRAAEQEKFEICVGAILTQNTAWTNVEKALENLHTAQAFSPAALLALSSAKLSELIRPAGYYNQKARYLRTFAAFITGECGGSLENFFCRDASSVRDALLSLKGIGPETADSMALYAGNKRVFVVDAYTIRIGRRLGWLSASPYQEVQSYLQGSLPGNTVLYNEFHALLVALAKHHCKTKPVCAGCPLENKCRCDPDHAKKR